MANLHDYYFRQRVTEQELDEGFEFLEQADFNLTVDNDLVGVQSGMNVAETGAPSLSVEVSGGVAYSKQGERIRVTGTQTVDVSVDENSITTEPANPGNSLVISVFIEFQRALGDSRIDGNSQVVFFNRFEDYQFIVRKGSEAASPGGGAEEAFITANAVAQDPDLIRVCDIIRANGQTQIFNADIFETVFREDAFVYSAGTLSVRAGTIKEADTANLQALSDHINDIGNAHSADAVGFDGTNIAVGWSALKAATDVQAAIEGIEDDLFQSSGVTGASLVGVNVFTAWADASSIGITDLDNAANSIVGDLAGASGAPKIGLTPTATWENAEAITAATVFAYLEEIVGDLADNTGTAGARRVGFDPAIAGPDIVSSDVANALAELDSGKASLGNTNTFTGPTNTFNNVVNLDGNTNIENAFLNDSAILGNLVGKALMAIGGEAYGIQQESEQLTRDNASGPFDIHTIEASVNLNDDDFGFALVMANTTANSAGSSDRFMEIGIVTWRKNGAASPSVNYIQVATVGTGITGGNPTWNVNNGTGNVILEVTHGGAAAQNLDHHVWVFRARANAA